MTAPQITICLIFLISLLIKANQHGKPNDQKHNFWHTLLAVFIWIIILYWGNFK
jgi:Mn2+/Fe2+ NRAMP family transporter